MGLIDTDAQVRYGVLTSLDPTFDNHLAQAESLENLFVALQDEEFRIREVISFYQQTRPGISFKTSS